MGPRQPHSRLIGRHSRRVCVLLNNIEYTKHARASEQHRKRCTHTSHICDNRIEFVQITYAGLLVILSLHLSESGGCNPVIRPDVQPILITHLYCISDNREKAAAIRD